jgi:hypothetical protein
LYSELSSARRMSFLMGEQSSPAPGRALIS